MKKMIVRLDNEHGWTLTELMASVFLIGILAYGFATAMIGFVVHYQETRDYMRLQQDMWSVLDAIRHGYAERSLLDQQFQVPGLIGLSTANRVVIRQEREEITMFPLDAQVGGTPAKWARIHRNNSAGTVLYNAQYENINARDVMIFPSSKARVGTQLKFQMTSMKFENLTPSLPNPHLVKVTLTGMVRFRQRARRQSVADDLKNNVRYVEMESTVYVLHSGKESV